MQTTLNFLSQNSYLSLPSSKNPKVILAVDDKIIAENSFKVYNPFSIEAKLWKKLNVFLLRNINKTLPKIIPSHKIEKSDFVIFLENKLKKPIITSLYFSTAKDKVVIQIQSNYQIIGYVKLALNEIGKKHLLNENRAINILSDKNIISPALLFDTYDGLPLLMLKDLTGEVKSINPDDIEKMLNNFRKDKKFQLRHHPGMFQIRNKLKAKGLCELMLHLEELVNSSTEYYYEVFEHGDFAPWNIITSKEVCIPFDFEHFEENGIEHMDLIKYYFQTGRLLKNYSKNKLLKYILRKLQITEGYLMIKIFLIKEILRNKDEKQPYSYELELLDLIQYGKS